IDRPVYDMIQFLAVLETHLPFGRMDVHIHFLGIDLKEKRRKRKFMLHQKRPVAILNGLGEDIIFDVPSVYKIVLKATIASGYSRFPDITADGDVSFLRLYFRQLLCDLPPIDLIDDFLKIPVSRSVQPGLAVLHKFKRNLRM